MCVEVKRREKRGWSDFPHSKERDDGVMCCWVLKKRGEGKGNWKEGRTIRAERKMGKGFGCLYGNTRQRKRRMRTVKKMGKHVLLKM